MPSLERRRSPRATLASRVHLRRDHELLGTFEVLNLAAGGLLLAGEPPPTGDALLEVSLPLHEEEEGSELVVPGRLLRVRPTRHGPTFVFTFADLSSDTAVRLQRKIDQNVARAQSARVLIVDDSREIGDALRLQLGWLGHDAHAVTTPLEAVRVLEGPNRVSCAIVDLVLGGADGLDLIAYLAEQHPHIRRVLMSGHGSPGQIGITTRFRPEVGPHEVLGKPWSESTLARALG
jgi:CheY-like chemotaxis protein